MKRIVRVVARNGVAHDIPMRAEEAAFFMKLTELEARNDPSITFHNVVADWIEKRQREMEERGNTSNLVN